jgi:endoglucanase
MKARTLLPAVCVVILAACSTPTASPTSTPPATKTPPPPPTATMASTPTPVLSPTPKNEAVYLQNMRLGRGVNLGNALEAPKEGEWGVTLQEDYFQEIKAAGFNSVRIPIRFSSHAEAEAPYTIAPEFMARVDWVVENALDQGLNAIIDMHHYLEMFEFPAKHKDRFVALWKQIAEHYADAPDSVYFELLNEPNGSLISEDWNAILLETLVVVRQSNPTRSVIVGPTEWYSVAKLEELQLPETDRNIIVSVHFYAPFQFTHQGAEWVANSDPWLGTTWEGDYGDRYAIQFNLKQAASWGIRNDRPIFLGEFGAYSKADMDSRARWTDAVARIAEEFGMSWAYWEFCAGFGVYDPEARMYREPLLKALIP